MNDQTVRPPSVMFGASIGVGENRPGSAVEREWHRHERGDRRLQFAPANDRAIRAGTWLIYVRWIGLLALQVLEVLALTIRFDTKTLEGGQPWLEGFFDLLEVGFDVVAVGAAVVLLAQWPRLRGALQCRPDRLQNHQWSM